MKYNRHMTLRIFNPSTGMSLTRKKEQRRSNNACILRRKEMEELRAENALTEDRSRIHQKDWHIITDRIAGSNNAHVHEWCIQKERHCHSWHTRIILADQDTQRQRWRACHIGWTNGGFVGQNCTWNIPWIHSSGTRTSINVLPWERCHLWGF